MCTNQALKCLKLAKKLSESFGGSSSEAYYRRCADNNNNKDQMKIFFKKRLKVLTGIEETTTFRDLISAILISTTTPIITSKSNLEAEVDRYVICETMNRVDKCLDSRLNVKDELVRIRKETALCGMRITHTMRLKSSIRCLPCRMDRANNPTRFSHPNGHVPILQEFIGGKY